ncbi:DUF305 domain-containing protein [Streptomyces sp. AVP053U2]|uniref:DUF305 domain-containing protein n=1 Tax=Streptomyces sp. AVP053U2 TaxID=1737066 RepID=UPI00073BDE38|nr:DUF305 domain-containing protein [Streptomyces sp. AVP053U2]ODA71341.1 hypothetical protein APS67_004509 [Streptomyces sp. AVP053U2]
MTSIRSLARRTGLVATAATAALVLAACGGNDGSDTGSGAQTSASAGAEDTAGAHNDQDVSFAQDMIPHHQQALQMAEMAATRASSAEVEDLASRIEKAQDPEIETMSGWLESWGKDVPGMMDTEDMDELMKASGKGFDTMFLTMMVEHHEGAVEMATTEKDEGRYGPAKKLAGDIITAQNAEIEEMNKLLGRS